MQFQIQPFHSLPVEILDYILTFLQSDKGILKACARSHPIFCQLVERHLYTEVVLQDTTSDPDDLHKVIRYRPTIANCVRTLEIEFYGRRATAFLEEISGVLPKLSELRAIQLRNTRCSTINWRMLPEKFRIAFLECLRLPSLTEICTIRVSFPLSILSHCKHIGNLSLKDWTGGIMGGSDYAHRLPTIDSLALAYCHIDALPAIISWIRSRHLSSLAFSDVHFGSLPGILNGCSHSLISLDVDIGSMYNSYYPFAQHNLVMHSNGMIPIQLSALPNLQQCIIRAQLNSDISHITRTTLGFSSPIFAIGQVLKPASSLKRLILDLYFFIMFKHHQAAQDNITDVLCTTLHALLVQSASPNGPIHLQINSMGGFVSQDTIFSMFAGHSYLMPFVEKGKLILTAMDANS